ncbi:MAG: cyclase family protein [Bacilli bacterium]
MIKIISYPVRVDDPGWPENPTLSIEQFNSMDKGEVANTYMLHLFNHFGSHMDGPNHFNPHGIQLYQVPVDKFVYQNVVLLDVAKGKEELVQVADILSHEDSVKEADLILFRSHFSQHRESNPDLYAAHGSGISAEFSKYLIEQCPKLKAVGMDWISLASYQHMDDGFLAHQYMLGMYHDRYILIIEDLNLENLVQDDLKTVIALPLRVAGIDSGPCTVIALAARLVP